MKNIKLKKLSLYLAAGVMCSAANAQIPVTDTALITTVNANFMSYFSPTGVFTRSMGQMQNAVKSSNDALRVSQQAAAKQDSLNQWDSDVRLRAALGQSAIAKRDAELYPTIQQCVEMTRRDVVGGAVRASMGGGSSGGVAKYKERAKAIVSDVAVLAIPLANKTAAGTCDDNDVAAGVCSAKGRFAGADVATVGIKANIDSSTRKGASEISNFSMSKEAYVAAQKNINDSVMYNAPKNAASDTTKAQLKSNPAYLSLYNAIMSKLNAASYALNEIANARVGAELPAGSMAAKTWEDSKSTYEGMFPNLAWTATPSLAELFNFAVLRDYMGPQDTEVKDEKQLLEDLNKKMALSNMIAWRSYLQQENTNILLSHMLTQMVTPINKSTVDAEFSKTVALKK